MLVNPKIVLLLQISADLLYRFGGETGSTGIMKLKWHAEVAACS